MDRTGAAIPARRRVKVMIGVAAAVVVALFAVANYRVLAHSIRTADMYVGRTEKTLVRNEFDHQIEQVVLYQSGFSVWDRSFEALADGRFGDDFVRHELRDWLWSEFGFSWMVFVTADGEIANAMYRGETADAARAGHLLIWVSDLTRRAEEAYYAALRRSPGGWTVVKAAEDRDLLTPALPDIHVEGLRMIDGTMSIVVVQAVIPKSLFIPYARKAPVLMVTVKPVSAKMLADAEQRLGLRHLGFSAIVAQKPDRIMTPIGGDTYNPMVASWKPNMPGAYVWTMTLPQLVVLLAIFMAVVAFMTLRFMALVKALQKSEARNAFFARHDPLTGLLNRSGFDEATAAASGAGMPFAVFAIDLDMFKAVNDRHGHAAGDAVLKAVAERFVGRVGEEGVVARLGGDEFAVLLRRERTDEALMALADGLVRDAQVPVAHDGQILAVGSSAGIARFPRHGTTVHDLMVVADAALYAAKNGGRNRAVLAAETECRPVDGARAA